jgi:pSer/pThr/pTyr-binding forkhead associated (FHA) protein
MFPDDTYVSSSHCRISIETRVPYIEDLGSSNGTYVRVRPDEAVEFGALLLIGHTQFRIQALPVR